MKALLAGVLVETHHEMTGPSYVTMQKLGTDQILFLNEAEVDEMSKILAAAKRELEA